MTKTNTIVENARKAIKEFIAYEVRLIYSFTNGNDTALRKWNGNNAASATIHDYDPYFWVQRVVITDNDRLLFLTDNGYQFDFNECDDIQKLIDISAKVESMYNEIINTHRTFAVKND